MKREMNIWYICENCCTKLIASTGYVHRLCNDCMPNNRIKLWVDDERPAPFEWKHVKRPEVAKMILKSNVVSHLSLDHDLGTEETGYDIASFLEEEIYFGRIDLPVLGVHSMNPVGRQNIQRVYDSIKRMVEQRGNDQHGSHENKTGTRSP